MNHQINIENLLTVGNTHAMPTHKVHLEDCQQTCSDINREKGGMYYFKNLNIQKVSKRFGFLTCLKTTTNFISLDLGIIFGIKKDSHIKKLFK